jgi:hypothetical protein
MRKTLFTIAAGAALASSSAWAGTITCQRIGDATVCSDGTIAQPLGDGAYVMRTPRDKWGQQRHDSRDPPCDGPGSPRDNRGQCEDDQ